MDYDTMQAFLTERKFYDSPEWEAFEKQYPELGIGTMISKAYDEDNNRIPEAEAQQARYLEYITSAIWDKYNSAPELKQKLIAADLGDEFKEMFLDKPEQGKRDYSKIPLSMLLGWANAVDVELLDVAKMQEPTPDPYKLTFTTDDQNKRYQAFHDEVEQSIGWSKVHELERQYFAITDKAQRAAFLKANPALKIEWEAESEFYDENQDILKIMERAGLKKTPTETKTQSTSDPRGAALNQAVVAAGLNWDTINAKKAAYNALPKGTGARTDYLSRNPDLLRYFQISGAIYNTDAEIQERQQQQGNRTSYGGGYTNTNRIRYQRPQQIRHYGGNEKKPDRIYLNMRAISGGGGQQPPQSPYVPRRITAGGY
jgi:hypothetical protein